METGAQRQWGFPWAPCWMQIHPLGPTLLPFHGNNPRPAPDRQLSSGQPSALLLCLPPPLTLPQGGAADPTPPPTPPHHPRSSSISAILLSAPNPKLALRRFAVASEDAVGLVLLASFLWPSGTYSKRWLLQCLLRTREWAGEMAQQLRVHTALAEDLG